MGTAPVRLAWWWVVAGVMGGIGCGAEHGSIVISHAAVSVPPAGAPAPAFLRIENRGSVDDTLEGVESPDADSIMLHAMVGGRMQPLPSLALAPWSRTRFRPGSYHLMLEGVRRTLAVGDTVTLVFRFATADTIAVRTPVLRYSEAVRQ